MIDIENKHSVGLRCRVPAASPDTIYGPPGRHIWVDDYTVNADGSIDIVAHYDKFQCRVCTNWFEFVDIDFHIGDSDICKDCAELEAGQHNCETCFGPAWQSNMPRGLIVPATTRRDDMWLCDACADRLDEIDSYD